MMESPKTPSLVKSRSKASLFQAASVVHLTGDAEDLERQQRVLNKRVERITFHLDCFVRIKVILDRPNGIRFHVIADRRNSIEYLMRQVEAEYTHRYAFPLTSDGEEPEAPIEGVYPLECGELSTKDGLVLKYEDVLGESLEPDHIVNVVNVFEMAVVANDPHEGDFDTHMEISGLLAFTTNKSQHIFAMTEPLAKTNSPDRPLSDIIVTYPNHGISRRKSTLTVDPSSRRKSIASMFSSTGVTGLGELPLPTPNLDDALLYELLRNTTGIESLIQFCLIDFTVENLLFWLDVQVFRSCPVAFASQFGGYIYNMYLVHDAPIKVNVSGDLMYDINSAIMNQVGVDMTMFDYAQQHVYSLIKIKTFARFRKSKGYASLESYRLRNEETYKAKSFTGRFYDGLGIKKLPALAEDAPKVVDFHNDEERDIYRDVVLEKVICRYYKDSRFFDEHGYFADPDNSGLERNQKRKMEKKITKFFGERPGAHDLDRQQYMIDCLKKAVKDNGENYLSQLDAEVSLLGDLTSNELPNLNPDAKVAVLKKKKFEKLVDFFGEPLPRDERKFMNYDAMLQYPDVKKSDTSLEDLEGEAVETINDLTPDEKKKMTKRARKIVAVLGDQSVQKTLKERGQRQSVTHQVGSALQVLSSLGVNSCLSPALAILPNENSSEINSVQSSTDSDEEEEEATQVMQLTEEEMKELRLLRKKRLSKLTAFLGEEAGTIEKKLPSPSSSKPGPLTKGEKVQQRKRIQKLERVMGELVTTDILEHAVEMNDPAESILSSDTFFKNARRTSTSATSNLGSVASPTKKKQPVTVFIPILEPKEMREDSPSPPNSPPPAERHRIASKHYDNIVKLNQMLQEKNVERALDLMDEMMVFDATDFNMTKSKQVRKKKLKKLRKFFGDTLNPVQLFEENVVAELEMTIADEVKDPTDLAKLNHELLTLRHQVAMRVADLQQGWSERQARKSGESETSAAREKAQ